MLDEPEHIRRLARFLCIKAGRKPDELRAGNMAFHSSFDSDAFNEGEYDLLFDNDPAYAPDGKKQNDYPAMFVWRDYVELARDIREFLKKES